MAVEDTIQKIKTDYQDDLKQLYLLVEVGVEYICAQQKSVHTPLVMYDLQGEMVGLQPIEYVKEYGEKI